VQAALADAGASVEVLDRSRWAALAKLLATADLLVNATPIGTESDECPVPAGVLRRDLAVLDLVYRPSPTRLVRDARSAGARARGGAGMLLRQAAASFTLWTGRPAPMAVMRRALEAELGGAIDA
jgi:shikimate dehydrogenase